MERRKFGNADLQASVIGLGCYGMSGVYGAADDAESIATIRRALDLGINLLDTSASYGEGHNHRLIGEAIRGRRHEVIIHSKSGSPRAGGPDAVRGGGDPAYLRRVCEGSLRNLGVDALDVFSMSRVDPNVPIEESIGAMAELVREGKTKYIGLSECSAQSLRRAFAVHPLASLQMEYSIFSRDAESQGQIETCRELGMAFMAYGILGRGLIAARPPSLAEMATNDIRARLPRFQPGNFERNLDLRSGLDAIAEGRQASVSQLAIAWAIARGRKEGLFIVPIPGAKTRAHLEENAQAAAIWLSEDDMREINDVVPAGAALGSRYPEGQMRRLNV